jgi:LacI family transcriptional regulator
MTLKDIAERAGVSMITVSRVINTPEKVSEKTREKVDKILDESGYIHNIVAHHLASKRSGIICMYASKDMKMLDPFFQQFLVGIGSALSETSYSMSLVNEIRATQFCDGYIFSGHDYSDLALEKAKKTGRPIALFGTIPDPSVDCIDTDNVNSAKKVVSYLIGKGHKRVEIVLNTVKSDYVWERMEGYKQALAENGISFEEKRVHRVENSMQGGMEMASWFQEYGTDTTALFFITDLMGIGFIIAMEGLGYHIPDDVSVVGFDGLGHHLLAYPRLTTVIQPVYDISRALAKCLLDRIQKPKTPPVRVLLDGELLEEDSVKTIEEV